MTRKGRVLYLTLSVLVVVISGTISVASIYGIITLIRRYPVILAVLLVIAGIAAALKYFHRKENSHGKE